MIHTIKKIIKHSLIYGLGRISGRLVGLVLLPLYTDNISVSDYGSYAILEIFIQICIILFTFGLNSALFRWMNIDKDQKYRGSIIFTTLTILITISIVVFFTGAFFKKHISIVLLGDEMYQDLFYYVFLIISIGIVRFILFNLIRVYEKSILFSVISLVSLIINLSLNIYLIAYLQKGIEGILIASALSSAFMTICLLFYFVKHVYLRLKFSLFLDMLKFGFPLIFSSIFGFIINMSDRYIIKLFLPLEFVGKYTFVYKIASTVYIFLIQSFLLAWPAIAWENIKKPNPEKFLSKMATYFTFLSVWVTLALSVLSKPIIFTISKNPEYNSAYQLVPLIAISFVFTGLYHIFGFPLHYKKKTKHFIQIVGIAAIVNLTINFTLIPYFGLLIAALATLISFLIMSVLSYSFSKKYFTFRLEITRLVKIFFIGISLYIIYYLNDLYALIDTITASIIIIFLYPLILYYFNFLEESEKRIIYANSRKLISKLIP